MLSQLFALSATKSDPPSPFAPDENLNTHQRIGDLQPLEVHIQKAKAMSPDRFGFITDLSLKVIWVHPDSVHLALRARAGARAEAKGPAKPRQARHKRAKPFPGTYTATQSLNALSAL